MLTWASSADSAVHTEATLDKGQYTRVVFSGDGQLWALRDSALQSLRPGKLNQIAVKDFQKTHIRMRFEMAFL